MFQQNVLSLVQYLSGVYNSISQIYYNHISQVYYYSIFTS